MRSLSYRIPAASASRNSSAASKPLIVPDVTGLDDFEAAHIYLDDGFTPVPWIPARKEKILHPAVMTGAVLNEWVATHAGIERWPDESRCGLLTSRASGVIAVDIDDRARFRAWLAENGYGDMFAVDAWSSTGRPGGGSHLLYDARAIANGSSNWPMQGKVTEAGFDLKSNGFIGAEPSLHPTGVPYLWHGETYRIRPIGGLADLLCKLRGTAGNSPRAEYDSTVQDWLDDYGAGDMCRYIRSVARNTAEAITGDAHGAIERISAIVRGTGEGHTGAASALQEIEAAFRAEARKRAHRARSGTAIDGEWSRMLASKVAQYGTDDVAESDPCDASHDVLTGTKPIVNGKPRDAAELEGIQDVQPMRKGTIQWLSSRKPKLVSWAWPGYMARGSITLLDGESTIGKTLTLYDVAARLSTGRPMPDGSQSITKPSTVLILAPEETIDTIIVPRLMAAEADLSKIAIPHIKVKRGKAPEMFLLPESAGKISDMIRESGAVLTIIDPISAFLAPTINSGVDSSVRSALSPLSLELGETDCAVAMVRHFNKNKGMDAKYRGGGSVAFGAIARVCLVAAKLPIGQGGPAQFGISVSDTNMTKLINGTLTYSIVDSGIQMDNQGHMVPRVEWHGLIDIDADTLVKGDRKNPGPAPEVQDEIVKVLDQMFSQRDTWDAADIPVELDKAGVSADTKTIAKARDKLGIRPERVYKPGGTLDKWVWTTKQDKLRVSRERTRGRGRT